MAPNKYLISLIFLLWAGTTLAASRSDLAKEKRWAEQIVPSLIVGEGVKLKAAGVEFLGIYTENNADEVMGGAIILHGVGVHPAWPDVINPIRMALPDHGWHTLSLQMPILANDAEYRDYLPLFDEALTRIQTAIDFLKKKGIKNIVLIGHSMGTMMASDYLASKPDPAVRALIGIGMTDNSVSPRMQNTVSISKIKIPVLDIFGSEDLERVKRHAKARRNAARKAGNKGYTQIKIEGANHFFNNMEDVLIKRIRGWLAKHAPGKEITIPKK